jgi:hypothetical protein
MFAFTILAPSRHLRKGPPMKARPREAGRDEPGRAGKAVT